VYPLLSTKLHPSTAPVARALFSGPGAGGKPVVDIYQTLITTRPCPASIVVLLKYVQTATIIITHDSLRLGRGDN